MQEQKSNKNKPRREVGQSLVEFALSGMLLAILFSGMIDFGRLYFTYVALEDSAGEAALYLSLYPDCVGPTAGCADPNNAIWRGKNAVGGTNLDWSASSTVVSPINMPLNPGVGDTVTISIRYEYTVITPMMQGILNLSSGDDTITIYAEAQQVIVSEN